MSKYLLLGLLIVGIAVGTYIGCDGAKARVGVAQDAAIKKIDDLLGPLNVQQKKVENAFTELKGATDDLRESRIKAQVQLKSLNRKKEELVARKKELLGDLTKLKTMLGDAQSTGSIKRGDREVTVAELNGHAENTMKKIILLKDKMTSNQVVATQWAKNLDLLKKNESTSDTQLKKLSDQLDQIRSKKTALDAMKEAATIAGPSASISDKFNDLTAEVDKLLVDVDAEWEIEKLKIDDRLAEVADDTLSLDDILGGETTTDVESTIGDIDKMLNEENQ